MLHVPFTVTVLPFAIVMGPALKPLLVEGMTMFSLMVVEFTLTIESVPNDGPPPPSSPHAPSLYPSNLSSVEL